jgi:hypothetical protein
MFVYVFFLGEYNIFTEIPEGKKLLGRPRRRWKENIRIDLREIGWEVVDRIHLAQYMDDCRALVNTVMNFRVPYRAGKFLD